MRPCHGRGVLESERKNGRPAGQKEDQWQINLQRKLENEDNSAWKKERNQRTVVGALACL